jgi:hypothetical protein
MHFNLFHFDYSARQILWTLTFASQLVLLVVLLGRDRMRRFPWFTASIALLGLELLSEVLLAGRMAMVPYSVTILTLENLLAIVGLMVLVEVAWHAFAGAPRGLWITNTVGLALVAGGVLYFWGPWPLWKDLELDTLVGKLRLAQLVAQKGEMLVCLLTVGVALLVVIFGRRYKAGWRSHAQMIVIGLSTAAIATLGLQAIFGRLQASAQQIIKLAQPDARQQYQHIVTVATKLSNAHQVIYILALVWWIIWLWRDEPGTAKTEQDEPPLEEEPSSAT